MGFNTGALRQPNVDEEMDYGEDIEVSSASIPSFPDQLPQSMPDQRQSSFDDVDQLIN